jgi:hypothetical protein
VFRKGVLELLSEDNEEVYHLVPQPFLLAVARSILVGCLEILTHLNVCDAIPSTVHQYCVLAVSDLQDRRMVELALSLHSAKDTCKSVAGSFG